jgi:hypothetical protein
VLLEPAFIHRTAPEDRPEAQLETRPERSLNCIVPTFRRFRQTLPCGPREDDAPNEDLIRHQLPEIQRVVSPVYGPLARQPLCAVPVFPLERHAVIPQVAGLRPKPFRPGRDVLDQDVEIPATSPTPPQTVQRDGYPKLNCPCRFHRPEPHGGRMDVLSGKVIRSSSSDRPFARCRRVFATGDRPGRRRAR